MKIADIISSLGSPLSCLFFSALVVTVAVTGFSDAAQRDAQTEDGRKNTKLAELGAEISGRLTIEVLMFDAKKDKERRPAENAKVHVEGTEDPEDTNEKGRARFFGVPIGKAKLKIKLIGEDMCTVAGVPVIGGDQLVKVLIEKAQQINCKALE